MSTGTATLPVQGSPEWLAARLGHITASKFGVVLTKGRSKAKAWGETAVSYALELAHERLSGAGQPEFTAAACEWGTDHEPLAVTAYEESQAVEVAPAGFVEHPLIEGVGGSSDGLIGSSGILEVKCPYTGREHLRTLWEGTMPEKHKPQVQGNLWVTGRDWCDFVSFDPRLGESSALFITRVARDADYIETLAERVEAFAALVSEIVEACRA